jgi:hypothetical protein
MSEIKNQSRYTGVDRRAPGREPGILKPGAAPRDLYKTGGRHGAITNTLYNWHSYKSWAEKIRGSWEEKKETAAGVQRMRCTAGQGGTHASRG